MRSLFAVSCWFVLRASLTVNIDLSDVTNKYSTVLYRTVVVYEKKNRSLVFSGSRKIPTLGSTVHWETRQASFPTGTVGPRVGIFLSPLNTNDGFYLSYMTTWLLSYMGRVKYSFIPKKNNQRTNILHISNSKAPRKDTRNLLTSHNVNDVTERTPRDDKGNVTLMAWEA